MYSRVIALIKKELRALLGDKSSLRMLIMPVVLQILLFPFAATLEVKNNTLAIYNHDAGYYSRELTERLAKAEAFSKLIILHNLQEVRDVIDNQKALLVVSLPNNFSQKIASGLNATIQILVDGRRSNAAQIASGYVGEIVKKFNADIKINNQASGGKFNIIVRNWFNPNLNYRWFILPSLIAMITTIGCLLVTAMSVAREREQGTFDQIRVSPLTPGFIMIGKTIPAIITALIQASIILLASVCIYRIPFQGSFILLYFCIILYGMALSGVGLFISSISSTQQQAFLGVFGFMMPAIMLSGFVAPIENIPEPLRSLTWLNPIRHFMVICKGIYLKNFNFSLVWPELWPLLFISFLTLFLAYVTFKKYSQ
jgi:ABC-2 type transport system permease protein